MDQINDYSDSRLVNGCIYCGGPEKTREHIPSKVLLESPFPTNLPVMRSCFGCNNGFSKDEEYVACLIECMIVNSANPNDIRNPRIAKTLLKNPSLLKRIKSATSTIDGVTTFFIEEKRLVNVIRKLAVGHAAFELSRVLQHEPTSCRWWLMSDMTDEEIDTYDAAHVTDLLGEIGTRNTQRLLVTQTTVQAPDGELTTINLLIDDWIEVQENKYRYHAIEKNDGVTVKIIFSEFIACEVFWRDSYFCGTGDDSFQHRTDMK